MKHKLLLLLVALLPMVASAYDVESNGIYYDISGDEATVTCRDYDYNSYSGKVYIAPSIDYGGKTYPVTSIGEYAFFSCEELTYVHIPTSVKSIAEYAFCYCYNLSSISIPSSVTSIGEWAFSDCDALTAITIPESLTRIDGYAFAYDDQLASITIPSSLTSIGYGVFSGCTNLTSITVKGGNPVYDSRNNCNAIIETATNTLVAACNGTEIPSTVTRIGDGAFSGCSELTSITIPNSVTGIGVYAFENCTNLTTITIPEGVESIDGYVFCSCISLRSITIPKSVTSIGYEIFADCAELSSVKVAEGNPVFDSRDNCNAIIETATNTLVAGCKRTIIPSSVTSIGAWAFGDCHVLTSITIPESLTSIGDYAFASCGLTSFTFPESVTSISEGVLFGCNYMTSVTIPSTVTEIGENAFAWCYDLADVYCFAEDVPTTGQLAFDYTDLSVATLHVPAASVEKYQTTAPWSGFGTIVALTDEDIANAIEDVKATKATTEVARYDIHGRKLSTPQRGINIIRYSDGKTKRVVVK